MRPVIIAISAMISIGIGAGNANAANARVCVDLNLVYYDHGPHDFWNEYGHKPRDFRGGKVTIIGPGFYYNGLLNQSGCTPYQTVPVGPASWLFQLHSESRVSQVDLVAKAGTWDCGSPPQSSSTQTMTFFKTVATSGLNFQTINVLYQPPPNYSRTFSVLVAAGESVRREFAGETNKEITFFVEQDPLNLHGSCSAGLTPNTSRISIDTLHAEYKFLISHEIGHSLAHFMDLSDACFSNGGSYGWDVSQCPPVAPSSHGPKSQEFQNAAISEGWAHFYAAASWNDNEENDCSFAYYHPIIDHIDCELSSSSYPNRYDRNQCPSYSLTDTGNETDWMKQVWDVYTDGSSHRSLASIGDAFDGAVCSGAQNGFCELDDSIQNYSGDQTIVSNWNSRVSTNGVRSVGQTCP